MPKFLIVNRKESNLRKAEIIGQSDWSSLRDDIYSRFKHGIVQRETVELLDIHYNLLGSILFKAMEIGLKRAKVKWFFPHHRLDGTMLEVETTNEKIAQLYNDEVLAFGFNFSRQDRLHFYLRIMIPNVLFEMLYEVPNDLWRHFTKLFNITTSRFWECVPHEDVKQKMLDNGNYGFYKFIKYLIATEIKPYSNPVNHIDTNGTIELTFNPYSDLEELTENLSVAIELVNKIFSYLLRKRYLKEKKKKI
jgi:hypothetical protein